MDSVGGIFSHISYCISSFVLAMHLVQVYLSCLSVINHLTAGVAYIRVLIFYEHIKYHILNMLKIKCDINEQQQLPSI